jgi:hypothetical protein
MKKYLFSCATKYSINALLFQKGNKLTNKLYLHKQKILLLIKTFVPSILYATCNIPQIVSSTFISFVTLDGYSSIIHEVEERNDLLLNDPNNYSEAADLQFGGTQTYYSGPSPTNLDDELQSRLLKGDFARLHEHDRFFTFSNITSANDDHIIFENVDALESIECLGIATIVKIATKKHTTGKYEIVFECIKSVALFSANIILAYFFPIYYAKIAGSLIVAFFIYKLYNHRKTICDVYENSYETKHSFMFIFREWINYFKSFTSNFF